MISDEYRALNVSMHDNPDYGTAGRKCAELVAEVLATESAESWLDYGCGKETLRAHVEFDGEYLGYDPAILGRDRTAHADVVTCTDVMEHVEPEFVGLVLADVMRLTRKAAVFAISCVEGSRRLPDGSLAHRSVHPPEWWEQRLSAFGDVEIRPPIASTPELVCIVRPHADD